MEKRIVLLLAVMLVSFYTKAQSVPFVKKDFIASLKAQKSDTIYIINFWATWCKPCLEELPAFEKINSEYAGKKVKVILVSNDFKKQVNSRLVPYIHEKQIRSLVVFMDESDPNQWIDLVDSNWGGDIPATLILKGSSSHSEFHVGVISEEELKKKIDALMP